MENFVYVKREDGEDIKIDLILSFNVEEFDKQYIAYTLNDDGVSETAAVFISEIDPETKRITSILPEQAEFVSEAYEEAKKILMEND